MADVKITSRNESGVSVARIEGRLDGQGAPAIEAYALARIGAGESRLVFNLAGVDYISSAGLRSLLVIAKKLQPYQGRLVLCSLTPMAQHIVELSGFHQFLKICAAEAEAIAAATAAGA